MNASVQFTQTSESLFWFVSLHSQCIHMTGFGEMFYRAASFNRSVGLVPACSFWFFTFGMIIWLGEATSFPKKLACCLTPGLDDLNFFKSTVLQVTKTFLKEFSNKFKCIGLDQRITISYDKILLFVSRSSLLIVLNSFWGNVGLGLIKLSLYSV